MRRPEAGFTLLEVLVALMLGATLVLAAHAAFGGAADAAAAIGRARTAHDSEMVGRAALTRLLANLDPASPGSVGFDGGTEAMRFSARLRGRDGLFVLRTVSVGIDDRRLVATAVADGRSRSSDSLLAALPGVEAVTMDYLLETGAESRWVQAWRSPVSAPIAIRLRLRRSTASATASATATVDTLLLAIGPRG